MATRRTVVPEGKQRVRVATGIYLKANGKYLAQYRDPGRRQHWREFRTKAEAQRWRAQSLLDPRTVLAGKRTLSEVWETYLEHHGASLRPSTLANWQQEWRKHIEPALGSWPIGRITIPDVKTFLAELEREGVGAATRQKCRAILHRVLQEAVENQEIGANPVAAPGTRVRLPQRKRARILTPDEVRRVVTAAARRSTSDALAIELMFTLGLRIGEMAGLQARDIDPLMTEITIRRIVSDAGGELRVQEATKTNKYRVIPLGDQMDAVSRLRAHILEGGLIGQSHLFPSESGAPIRPNNWRRRVWAGAMQAARIPDPPTPHAARRTTSSLLSQAGVPPATIQAILGHSTLQQTGDYIDVPAAAMRQGLQRLSLVYQAASDSQ